MINLALGIAIGAAFAPFWIKTYQSAKAWIFDAYTKYRAGK
jgi:hypothetical protein